MQGAQITANHPGSTLTSPIGTGLPGHDDVVTYGVRDRVAYITMNRPRFRNAQNSKVTYGLDNVFYRAADDDLAEVVVLQGSGADFSAGHDIGSPGRDVDEAFDRRAGLW